MEKDEYSLRLPKGRVKRIIKNNEDIKLMNKNVDAYIGKAAEFFLQELALKAETIAKYNKRRTINPEDICKYIFYV